MCYQSAIFHDFYRSRTNPLSVFLGINSYYGLNNETRSALNCYYSLSATTESVGGSAAVEYDVVDDANVVAIDLDGIYDGNGSRSPNKRINDHKPERNKVSNGVVHHSVKQSFHSIIEHSGKVITFMSNT